MRVIVLSPRDAPAALVSECLALRTFAYDDVTLVTCAEHANATAQRWRLQTWGRFRRKMRPTNRCAKEQIHYLPEYKDKNKAYTELWRDMVTQADRVIVFKEVGEEADFFAQGVLKLAKLFDLPVEEVLF